MEENEKVKIFPPNTYMEWLEILDLMQKAPGNIEELGILLRAGTFNGSKTVLSSLERRIISAINYVLTKSVERLNNTMNMCIEDNSYCEIIHSYHNLKKTILAVQFFESLEFLPNLFIQSLKDSISKQMIEFEKDFKNNLKIAAVENPNTEFESAIIMINYIKLFD